MKITQKGQVTIPQDIRNRYHLLPYTEVKFVEEDGRVYIVKDEPSLGKYSPFDMVRGKATTKLSTEEIMKLTRLEPNE